MVGLRRVITGALLAAALAGCAGSGDGDDDQNGGNGCTPPATPTISYATNIQPIYDTSCATAGPCHNASAVAFGLNLTAAASYDATVNVESIERPQLFFVEPGNPDDSYLVRKIEGGPDIAGDQMPIDAPPLTADQITAIRQWITECALDN
jgi:hypothetical protein